MLYKNLTIEEVDADRAAVKTALRQAGISPNVLSAIETRAMRTGRKLTGPHATNRDTRWSRSPDHPQYGTEFDCKVIAVKLFALIFCFDNAPVLADPLRSRLEQRYLGHPIEPGTHRDSLLLEQFDFNDLAQEGLEPVHGHSSFHMGHEDPSVSPKHTPANISWRTMLSNLIQGNMTLREARVYFIKLIARYFELGELDVH
jgi:hypothetical protein